MVTTMTGSWGRRGLRGIPMHAPCAAGSFEVLPSACRCRDGESLLPRGSRARSTPSSPKLSGGMICCATVEKCCEVSAVFANGAGGETAFPQPSGAA